MGHLFSKKELDNATNKLNTSTDNIDSENDSKLYKAIEEFAWKNASPAEIHKDSLPHYADKFKQFAH